MRVRDIDFAVLAWREIFRRVREWWDQRRAYDFDSRDELYELPPLVIPIRAAEPSEERTMPENSLDRVNAKARKASFATHDRAEKWAHKVLRNNPGYSWGYTIQTREGTKKEGAKPWFVRFTDK